MSNPNLKLPSRKTAVSGSDVDAAVPESRERRLVWGLIAVTFFLTSLPYLLGYAIVPQGFTFIGTAYNIDDYCNYLSWLRQTADGHFFLHNFFTTDPQKGLEFNLFFWLLGQFAHLTHLSPQLALQVARVGGCVGLLWLLYRFYRYLCPTNPAARMTAFAFAGLSSGWGWLIWTRWQNSNPSGSPVDAWQPEAYTFLSIYTSALFTVSTLLILGALYALLRGEETGKWRYPIIAGICGGILGNIHSYDVLHIAAAWGLFLIVWTIRQRGRGVGKSWLRSLVALALILPTTGYEYYAIHAEKVFGERAAVKTTSPAIWHYALGYGIVFLLALAGWVWIARSLSAKKTSAATSSAQLPNSNDPLGRIFIACWAVAGFLVIYLPVAFQRKMLMGEHLPLCLLAGYGAAALTKGLTGRTRIAVLALLVLLSFPSNAFFLRRDMVHLVSNKSETTTTTGQVPFLTANLTDAYAWLRANTQPSDAVLGYPPLCTSLPGLAGRAVWAGHWGETPQYGEKVSQFARFADVLTPDDARRAFLAGTHTNYFFYPNDPSPFGYTSKNGVTHALANFAATPPSYLVPVYHNKDYTVFRIDLGP